MPRYGRACPLFFIMGARPSITLTDSQLPTLNVHYRTPEEHAPNKLAAFFVDISKLFKINQIHFKMHQIAPSLKVLYGSK